MRRSLLIGFLLLAFVALCAPAAAAPRIEIASGVLPSGSGGYPWLFEAQAMKLGRLPGLCLYFHWAWAPGQPLGTGGQECVFAASGHPRRFDLHAASGRGIAARTGSGALGEDRIRSVVMALDPRVRRVKVVFRDGQVRRARSHRAPRRLGRKVRFAWVVDKGQPLAKRIAGYDRRGKRVAGWPRRRR